MQVNLEIFFSSIAFYLESFFQRLQQPVLFTSGAEEFLVQKGLSICKRDLLSHSFIKKS